MYFVFALAYALAFALAFAFCLLPLPFAFAVAVAVAVTFAVALAVVLAVASFTSSFFYEKRRTCPEEFAKRCVQTSIRARSTQGRFESRSLHLRMYSRYRE